MENVKKLSHHVAVSGAIKYEALLAAYAIRTLTAPEFEQPLRPVKGPYGNYDNLEKDIYIDKKSKMEKKKST